MRLLLLSALALSACAKVASLQELEPVEIPEPTLERGPLKPVVFRCPDGKEIRVLFLRGGTSALLSEQGEDYPLPRVPSGSGARYSDGHWDLWTKGDEAALSRDDVIVRAGCRTAP